MRVTLLLLTLFFGANAGAIFGQGTDTDPNLIAYYPMDGEFTDATGDTANGGIPSGVPEFGCGVLGQAVALNGGNDFIRIPGGNTNNVNREFDSEDFTLSFYFKPVGFNGTQYLVSKRDTNCNNQQFFAIRYQPSNRAISVLLRQNNQEARIDYPIRNGDCWQHVVLLRQGNRVRLYINAEEVGEAATSSPVDITNDGELLIGSTECRLNGEIPFDGLIDELRVYRIALGISNIRELYLGPDRIQNETTRLFLGESAEIDLNSNCGITYEWTPSGEVDSPSEEDPFITPVSPGRQVYTVRITDAESNCTAIDSIIFQVIDPSTLDCAKIYLPKAFTPNGVGPSANETFGISNPFAIPELISFEIYDRYGAQMFQTTDVFEKWDGNFKGNRVLPGPAVWRIVYRCEGEELVVSGSVMVLR